MTTSDTHLPELPVGVVGDNLTQVTPAARTVHQAILRAFATTGHAPDTSALAAATPARASARCAAGRTARA